MARDLSGRASQRAGERAGGGWEGGAAGARAPNRPTDRPTRGISLSKGGPCLFPISDIRLKNKKKPFRGDVLGNGAQPRFFFRGGRTGTRGGPGAPAAGEGSPGGPCGASEGAPRL